MKKTISVLLMVFLLLTGCSGGNKVETVDIADSDLFYTNKTELYGADPHVLVDVDSEGKQCFYMYVTTKDLNCKGFNVYTSYNLGDWRKGDTAFMAEGIWCDRQLWAPEVIKDGDTYYLFYSGQRADENQGFYLSVATSKSPAGPFTELSNENKNTGEPLIAFEEHVNEMPAKYRSSLPGHDGKIGYIKAIDASTFVDPVTGKKYLYFVADLNTEYTENSFIFGMEMEDWATPKYETLTKITEFGLVSPDSEEIAIDGGRTNEGCFVWYHEGTYYLHYSTFTYMMAEYQVRQAISNSPLGPFEKITYNDGGTVIYTEATSIRQSAGHNSLFMVGDELYIVYHSFYNDLNIDGSRKPAVDKVVYVKNSQGQLVMQANGPTSTPQPLPEAISGYKNLALDAKISCDNTAGSVSVDLLNDGFIPLHRQSPVGEFITNPGETNITIDFGSNKNIKAVLVYTSIKDFMRLSQLDEVNFISEDKNITVKEVVLDDERFMRNGKIAYDQPCALILAEEIEASSINIKLSSENSIGIPEIIVLGR